MQITAILAMDSSLLIGSKNGLPWHIPEDMKRFKEFTTGGIVVMGRNTYLSLPERFRPLPNRRNIVITRTEIDGVECYSSIELFISAMQKKTVEQVWLIGGASLYDQFFARGLVDRVELTLLDGEHEGDIRVSEFCSDFHEISSTEFSQGRFITLVRNS
ncbi:dihydrofolate reductase [Candidatus Gracilibacteria bacterium]|nr:dihydrofolate reductase [Candidatus Gracilibacteria bacterium]